MTTGHQVTAFVAAAAVLASGVFVRGWELERKARNQAETVAVASQKVIAAKNLAIAQRDQAAAVKDAQLNKQAATITTLQQAVTVVAQHLEPPPTSTSTPAPAAEPIVTVNRSDLSAATQAKLPNAPSYAIFTDIQAEQIARQQLTCDVTAEDLKTCKADLADRVTQFTAATTEAQAWKTADKGGTKFHRFLGVARQVLCSAVGGYAGARIDRGKPANGAAIGPAAGVTGCSFF